MKFKILGSGGCMSLPKPLCQCDICTQAREKGVPYSRFGCAAYIENLKLLIDTPEDIAVSLNHFHVKEIQNIFFSHWDPDHTMGMRIFEQLRLNWQEVSLGRENENPLHVFGLDAIIDDISHISGKYGSFFDYYEKTRKLITTYRLSGSLQLGDTKIHFVGVEDMTASFVYATTFVFESSKGKLIYAPCDVKPFPHSKLFQNAHTLVIGSTLSSLKTKNGFCYTDENPLRKELFSMEEVIALKEKYQIQTVVITHLEEDWGFGYDDYLRMQEQYEGILFAYDGMEIEV